MKIKGGKIMFELLIKKIKLWYEWRKRTKLLHTPSGHKYKRRKL